MLKINRNIRNQLLFTLGTFSAILLGQLALSVYSLNEMKRLSTMREAIADAQINWLSANSEMFRYLNTDINKERFYSIGSIGVMKDIQRKQSNVDADFEKLLISSTTRQIGMLENLQAIRKKFSWYSKKVQLLEEKILEKGFKDHGLEGKMRNYIHKLESIPNVPAETVLRIRRHEKDFILRKDSAYVHKLMTEVEVLHKQLARNEEHLGMFLLSNYQETFLEYTKLSSELGKMGESGIIREVELLSLALDKQFKELTRVFNRRLDNQMEFLKWLLLVTTLLVVILSIFLSFYIANKITRPIRLLTDIITQPNLDESVVKLKQIGVNSSQPDELEKLKVSFLNLGERITGQMHEIELKNDELRDQNKSLEQLNMELDRFIYHTSHDLRSPLTAVLGLIEVIEVYKDEDITEYLEHMKTSINQLDMTILQIIQFYKNQNTSVDFEDINLYAVVDSIFKLYQHHPKAKGIEFTTNLGALELIKSDHYRLTIILKNLISNAIKYSDAKKELKKVEVSTYEEPEYWVIKVSDNGIGMDTRTKQNLFTMFYRGSAIGKGSGLGLYIIKESLKRINGVITLDSELGRGTSFFVKIKKEFNETTPTKTNVASSDVGVTEEELTPA